MTAAFRRLAKVTASTKRNTTGGGRVLTATVHLAALQILPLMPVSPEIVERYALQSPRKSFVTYTAGAPDVTEKDILTVAGKDLPVRAVGPWPDDRNFLEIVVEQV